VLQYLKRRSWLLVLIAILVFALPTWWMRVWLPHQGGLPTATAVAGVLAEDDNYARALELAASDPEAALPLLNEVAFSENQNAQQARALWNAIQSGRLDEPAFLYTKTGQALAANGEWVFARQALLKAVELDPNYAEAWAYLGEALQQTGEDGYPALLQAMRLDPDSVGVRLFTALYWQRQNDYEQAGRNLRIAALHDPSNPLIQIQLGQNAVLNAEGPDALDYFEQALDLAPDNPAILRALARYSVETELYINEVGLPAARHLLLEFPQDVEVLVLNARALALAGNSHSADAFFQRALQLDDRSAEAHLYYAMFLLANGQEQAAKLHFDFVLSIESQGERADLAAYWLEQISH
jgi:Tfp pilus assembly protein PilF